MAEELDMTRIPQHIAITMDGNGRWATERNKPRSYGHQAGVDTVRRITSECVRLGVKFLTLYTFSTENWNRPKLEIEALMRLLSGYLKKEVAVMQANNIRLNTLGDISQFPKSLQKELQKAKEQTQNNTGTVVSLALGYGSQQEILQMTQQLAQKVKEGTLSPEQITYTTIEQHLYTQAIPPVDLLVRTSGEYRISNFLLWQIAYAELYFTDAFWPDFTTEELHKALLNYQQRERRFGKTSEQLT